MTTETVCVPRELLLELRDTAYVEAQQYHEAMQGYRQHEHDRLDKIVADVDALLAQPVASEPAAWQWLNTAHFRRKIPKYANACHWDPLYRHPPAPAIPAGYALVPIEPTEAMRDAGNIYSLNRATLMRIWAEMLAAAPQPTHGGTDR